MLVHEVPVDKLKQCLEKVAESFNPASSYDKALMKEGLDFFRKGLVYNAAVDGNVVTAVVEGAGKHTVELHLDFIEISDCSCDRHVFCSHKLAVLFYLQSHFGSAGEFVNNWRFSSGHSKSSKDLFAPGAVQKKESLPFKEDSIEDWITYFNLEFQTFLRNEGHEIYISMHQQELTTLRNIYHIYYPRLLHTAVPEKPNNALLFFLHASLTTFYKMIEKMAGSSFHYHSTSALSANVRELVDEIFDIVADIKMDSFDKEDFKLLYDSIPRFNELVTIDERFRYERLFLYRTIWWNLLSFDPWMDQFQKELSRESRQYGEGKLQTDYTIALIHFHFMKNEDDLALNLLEELHDADIMLCSMWIRMLIDRNEWERVEKWLRLVIKKTTAFVHSTTYSPVKQECVSYYLHCLKDYEEGTNSNALFHRALEDWLPFSYPTYSHYLLEQENFKQWTELQLVVNASVDHIDRDVIKEIEKKDRESLLPLYHQAVIQQIEEKNRNSYRQAVKYLRKLRTHYRNLKQFDVWEAFIRELSIKYKRLRAFQEEIRKGKGPLLDE